MNDAHIQTAHGDTVHRFIQHYTTYNGRQLTNQMPAFPLNVTCCYGQQDMPNIVTINAQIVKIIMYCTLYSRVTRQITKKSDYKYHHKLTMVN